PRYRCCQSGRDRRRRHGADRRFVPPPRGRRRRTRKGRFMKFAAIALAEAEGAVLAHALKLPDGRLKKGTVLSAADIDRIRAAGIGEIVAARLEAGDVGEDEAARRIGAALGSDTIRTEAAATGR